MDVKCVGEMSWCKSRLLINVTVKSQCEVCMKKYSYWNCEMY